MARLQVVEQGTEAWWQARERQQEFMSSRLRRRAREKVLGEKHRAAMQRDMEGMKRELSPVRDVSPMKQEFDELCEIYREELADPEPSRSLGWFGRIGAGMKSMFKGV